MRVEVEEMFRVRVTGIKRHVSFTKFVDTRSINACQWFTSLYIQITLIRSLILSHKFLKVSSTTMMLSTQLAALILALAPLLVSAGMFPKDSLVKTLDHKTFKQAMKANVSYFVD